MCLDYYFFFILILDPPSLTTKPSDQTVTENDEVTFHCTAIGNPVPEISWTKDGKTVGQGNTLRFEASRDHSGEYWCSADNGLSDAVNSNADLDVQCEYKMINCLMKAFRIDQSVFPIPVS